MRIGINASGLLGRPTVDRFRSHAAQAAEEGFHSYWLAQTGVVDALTMFAAIAEAAPAIELGTAVVPTYFRHPSVLAGQALTTAAVVGPRLVLGIGLSHGPVVESRYRMTFERNVRHLNDYLDVLQPLLESGKAAHDGEVWSYHSESARPTEVVPSVMVAALGPQMLRVTGRRTDGTILWMVGERTIARHIAPTLNDAAAAADRPSPRILCGLPMCVTSDAPGVRARAARMFALYGDLPSYRAMLDREGVESPADVALIGDEDVVGERISALKDAGATDFAPVEFASDADEAARTRALLRRFI
jgi:5,10-methylenetetrahydromethanopterin reductase